MSYSWNQKLRVLSLCMGVALGTSCGSTRPNEIALVLKTLSNPFFVQMRQGAEREAQKHSETRLIIQATRQETDTLEQNQIVENLLTRHVAVVCITPNDSTGVIAAIRQANDRNVPVVIVDTRVDEEELARQGARIASFIGSDNERGGVLAAGAIASAIGDRGDVALLEGAPGQETAISRSRGFLQEIARHRAIRVVARQTAYWEREKGYSVTQSILTAHPSLRALFACNDEMALGAARAAADMKRPLRVVGFDYTPDAQEAIRRGELYASVAQSPEVMGERAVQTALELLAGRSVERIQSVPVELKKARADK